MQWTLNVAGYVLYRAGDMVIYMYVKIKIKKLTNYETFRASSFPKKDMQKTNKVVKHILEDSKATLLHNVVILRFTMLYAAFRTIYRAPYTYSQCDGFEKHFLLCTISSPSYLLLPN